MVLIWYGKAIGLNGIDLGQRNKKRKERCKMVLKWARYITFSLL